MLARVNRWLPWVIVTAFLVLPLAAVAADEPVGTMAGVGVEQSAPLPASVLEDDDLRMRFAGSWGSYWLRSASGQTQRSSKKAGSYMSASIEGTGVALVSRPGINRGRARIYVDGVATATVDLYAPQTGARKVVWRSAEMTHAVHSVKVVVLGTKTAASKDTHVPVDALLVTGRPRSSTLSGTFMNNGNSKLVKTGRWAVSTREKAYGGSAWRTSARGASVTVRFKGTGVTWLGRKDSYSGKASVYLDGRRVGTVSQFRSTSAEKRVAWSATGLPNRVHTLTIRTLASPSSGTGTRVDVDAFLVNGTPLQAYRPTPFSYPWRTYIVIDKSQFRLYWVRDGLLIKTYPIAHGKPGTPTPSRVWRINAKYYTDPSSVYGPRKMRLFRRVSTSSGYRYEYTRYLIHGTNQPWVIGTQASHGCIRMYNKDVLELWPQVPLGTMVVTRD